MTLFWHLCFSVHIFVSSHICFPFLSSPLSLPFSANSSWPDVVCNMYDVWCIIYGDKKTKFGASVLCDKHHNSGDVGVDNNYVSQTVQLNLMSFRQYPLMIYVYQGEVLDVLLEILMGWWSDLRWYMQERFRESFDCHEDGAPPLVSDSGCRCCLDMHIA